MNRRTFNSILISFGAGSVIPIPVPANRAAVPPSSYAWAELIARTQSKCSPEMLAKHLRVSPQAAQDLFQTLLHNGVLQAPGITGAAIPSDPIDATGTAKSKLTRLTDLLSTEEDAACDPPMVKDDQPSLGCDSAQAEEDQDAGSDKHFQEITERG
ncbi:hypothetical protein Z946_1962 [Sulfitobacter noctilucicola]|uniref:Uncharacterized protein n=1 Tax=Sulfitobacter noctilucicola TaxID=1342301 RepID=A0A7W6Q2T2_9RHOB|nr:hypothetical protein [Sulfitobacter noctilucicola]KIN63099.1 hypothetical protein Z946_1962 [Sulfitobacter noctilucicola]MBB4172374.1 hypothetical protein [Sulfitobacter noctilucicola]